MRSFARLQGNRSQIARLVVMFPAECGDTVAGCWSADARIASAPLLLLDDAGLYMFSALADRDEPAQRVFKIAQLACLWTARDGTPGQPDACLLWIMAGACGHCASPAPSVRR